MTFLIDILKDELIMLCSILFPEGSSNIPLVDKRTIWQREADKIIQNNRELKVAII